MKKTLWMGMALLLLPMMAAAQPCESDDDCEEGEGCVKEPCATCAPGEECPPCDPQGECVAMEPAGPPTLVTNIECDSDADCPTFFACTEQTLPCANGGSSDCACAGCDSSEGEECPPCECPEPDETEWEDCGDTLMVCTWTLQECEADADCGAGFECMADEVCYGSGGGGCACAGCVCPDCPEGEECPPCDCPEEIECDCPEEEPEGEVVCETVGAWCVPAEVECADASACPEGWECADVPNGNGTSCSCGPCACDSEGGEDCECPPCECGDEEEQSALMCLPAGWSEVIAADAVVGYEGEMSGGGSYEGGAADDLFGGGEQAGGGEGGGGVGGPGTSEDPKSPTGESDEDNSGGSGVSDDDRGGCSAVGTSAGGALAMLLLALFAVVTLRRRVHADRT
jgi:uncharacterized protein (TIGR03382 family)